MLISSAVEVSVAPELKGCTALFVTRRPIGEKWARMMCSEGKGEDWET